MSGVQKARHQPDGKEDGTDSSVNLKTSKETLEGTSKRNEAEATSEVTTINNQLSDDSLEDDAVADTPVVNNTARDSKVDAGYNAKTDTNTTTAVPTDSPGGILQNKHSSDLNGKVTDERVSQDNNGGNCVTPELSNDHSTNKSDNISKATASEGNLQSNSLKSSQLSSRFSNSSSRIPVLKGSKGKPSPLVEPHKASAASVAMTTPGEFPHQEVNSPALQSSEDTDTPVSVAFQDIPSSDSLHQNVEQTGYTRKESTFSNKHKEAGITTLAYHREWNAQNSTKKPSQLPGVCVCVCMCVRVYVRACMHVCSA